MKFGLKKACFLHFHAKSGHSSKTFQENPKVIKLSICNSFSIYINGIFAFVFMILGRGEKTEMVLTLTVL